MRNILAINDLRDVDWSVTANEIGAFTTHLHIGFCDGSPVLIFDNLEFGFELIDSNNNIVQYGVYPHDGNYYISTTEDYVKAIRLRHKADENYNLYLWAKNSGNKYETTFSVQTSLPTQPYESWSWDSAQKIWTPPVKYPQDGGYYNWNETEQIWDKVNDE